MHKENREASNQTDWAFSLVSSFQLPHVLCTVLFTGLDSLLSYHYNVINVVLESLRWIIGLQKIYHVHPNYWSTFNLTPDFFVLKFEAQFTAFWYI